MTSTLKTLTAGTMVAAALTIGSTQTAQAFGPEAYIGSVSLFASNFCPRNTLEADGKLLQISSNTALFSLLGTTYGGDGRTTFGLPNMKPPAKGLRYCVIVNGIYPSRS